MYQPHDGKPIYNQPPSASAATGFPVSVNNTTSAYAPPPPPPKPLAEWSTGLCGCLPCFCAEYEEYQHFWWTLWCPCITFGQVAAVIDKGSFSCSACCESCSLYALLCGLGSCWLYSCYYRSKMRQQFGLKGNACTDCLKHLCCEPCALSQEYRELQNRGFNMNTGNVEQKTGGIAMPMATTPPTAESNMTR